MHRHRLNKNNIGRNMLKFLELDSFLLISMGFFSDVKKQKIKFNSKPFSNPENMNKMTFNQESKEKNVDIHLSLIKRIDGLIEENKEMTKNIHNPLFINTKQVNIPFSSIVEIREPSLKRLEMPPFRNELKPNNFDVDIGLEEEFFEIEFPKVNQNEKEKNEEVESWMLNEEDANKTFQGIGKIRIRRNDNGIKTKTAEDNDVTKTKLELELTKKEIEDKKVALENAIKEEKQKEIELKKIRELKLKEERLKKLEMKKKQKEEKIKERENLKLQKEKEKELKKIQEIKLKQEKLEQLEKLKQQEKLEQLEKLKQPEKQEQLEKLKQLEKIKLQEKLKTLEQKEINTDLFKKETKPIKSEENIDNKNESSTNTQILDQDVAKILPIIDSLFDNLPENIIQQFAESKEFEIYQKVLLKYTNK